MLPVVSMQSFGTHTDTSCLLTMATNSSATSSYYQRLSLGEVFSRTFSIFFSRFDVFMPISALVHVPLFLYFFIMTFLVVDSKRHMNDNGTPDVDYVIRLGREIVVLAVLSTLGFIIITCVGRGAICTAVGEIYLDMSPEWKAGLKTGMKSLGPLIVASLIVGLGLVLSFLVVFVCAVELVAVDEKTGITTFLGVIIMVLLFPAFLFVAVKFLLTVPAIMVEGKGPIDAIKRSWELTNIGYCFIFCAYFLFEVAKAVIQNLFISIIMAGRDPALAPFIRSFANTIPSIFYLPLLAM